MIMSAAQWGLRLENEYGAMCAFPINRLFAWEVAPGQKTPRCRAYLITYHVRTMIKDDAELKPQETTKVLITLPDDPSSAPTARIVGGRIPFHPNIYESGNICLGSIWKNEPRLWKLVVNIGKVLAFDPAHTNPDSPANKDAALDWKTRQAVKNKPYPCGNINFPHPMGY